MQAISAAAFRRRTRWRPVVMPNCIVRSIYVYNVRATSYLLTPFPSVPYSISKPFTRLSTTLNVYLRQRNNIGAMCEYELCTTNTSHSTTTTRIIMWSRKQWRFLPSGRRFIGDPLFIILNIILLFFFNCHCSSFVCSLSLDKNNCTQWYQRYVSQLPQSRRMSAWYPLISQQVPVPYANNVFQYTSERNISSGCLLITMCKLARVPRRCSPTRSINYNYVVNAQDHYWKNHALRLYAFVFR